MTFRFASNEPFRPPMASPSKRSSDSIPTASGTIRLELPGGPMPQKALGPDSLTARPLAAWIVGHWVLLESRLRANLPS